MATLCQNTLLPCVPISGYLVFQCLAIFCPNICLYCALIPTLCLNIWLPYVPISGYLVFKCLSILCPNICSFCAIIPTLCPNIRLLCIISPQYASPVGLRASDTKCQEEYFGIEYVSVQCTYFTV